MFSADQLAPIGAGVVVVLAALLPPAALLAWLLRTARLPGGPATAGILGGAIAGTLLGASVLSKAAPDLYTSIYVGGVTETAALQEAQRGVERDMAAMRTAGVSAIAAEEHRERVSPKLAAFTDQVTIAQEQRARAVDSAGLLLGCALFALGAGWAGKGRRREMTGSAVASGLGMVLAAGVPMGAVAAWIVGLAPAQAWTLGAVVGIGSAWPTPRSRRLGIAGRAPQTEAAALAAWCFGAAGVLIAVLSGSGADSFAGAWAIVFVGGAMVTALWRPRLRRPRSQRRALSCAHGLIVPALAAAAVAPIDIQRAGFSGAALILMIAALLIAADGRWFGAWLGWRCFGDETARTAAWRRAAAMLGSNVGAISIAAALLGRSAGLLSDAAMLAVLVGALLVEITTDLRRRFAVAFDAGFASPGLLDDDDAHDS